MFFLFLIPSSFPGFQCLNCFDILGGIMNWTMPQMLAVSKQDPSLTGRWDPYDSLTGEKRTSKGESWGGSGVPVQLFLPFSPQFNNPPSYSILISCPMIKLLLQRPSPSQPRNATSQCPEESQPSIHGGVYIIYFSFHRLTQTSTKMMLEEAASPGLQGFCVLKAIFSI